MKINLSKAIILLFLLLPLASLQAKVKLPSIPGDNMVLQQKTAVKLWGWSKKETKIKLVGEIESNKLIY